MSLLSSLYKIPLPKNVIICNNRRKISVITDSKCLDCSYTIKRQQLTPFNIMSENDNPQYDPFAVPEGYDPNGAEKQQQEEQALPPEEPWYKKNPAMTNFVALVIAIIAVALFVYLPQVLHKSTGADYPTIGYPSPVFQIEPLSDNENLKPFTSYNLVGKTTLVNIWGPWCGSCLQEAPHLSAINKELSKNPNFQYISVAYPPDLASGFEKEKTVDGKFVLKINPDIKEQKELFQKMSVSAATSAGFSGKEIYWDPDGILANALFQSFPEGKQRGIAFPTTILFDNQKVIRAVWVGYTPGLEKQIEEKTKELLNQTSEQ